MAEDITADVVLLEGNDGNKLNGSFSFKFPIKNKEKFEETVKRFDEVIVELRNSCLTKMAHSQGFELDLLEN